ncbi:39S ribosomal protein L32 mitochondrial [Echinococcus multilocularis]|uniref:39S ribosomal protein L32 mitochondrial n=1 Tax=Echinococcus multilocularis TaxID=6211 RepID=A0A068YER6_ECHMU|nr:39S ribosomal protein L32 mitochondrial [Echinococcus multilocularis]
MRGFCGKMITRAKFIIDLISGRGSYGLCFVGPSISPTAFRLSDIWDLWNGSIFFATPKKRRSIGVRRDRKFLSFTMDKYRLRRDLVTCPHCGSWHPRESICVHCYDEVRRETNALRASLRSVREGLSYDQETQFLYDQETFGKAGAYTHRVNRKRPSWFPANLLGLSSPDSPSK